MNTATAAALLTELASGIPALPHAACRGRAELFDSTEPADIERATQICSRCPDLEPYREWAAALPPRTLSGVVGGHLYHMSRRRR